MANRQRMIHAMAELAKLDQPLGWITSGTVSRVTYPNAPANLVAEVQQHVDFLVGGLPFVYLVAVFEQALPHGGRGFPEWQDHHLTPDERRELYAHRHVRHVMAHGLRGSRQGCTGDQASQAFEDMKNAGLLPNVHWDQANDVISFQASSVWNPLRMWMLGTLQNVIARCGDQCQNLGPGQSCLP